MSEWKCIDKIIILHNTEMLSSVLKNEEVIFKTCFVHFFFQTWIVTDSVSPLPFAYELTSIFSQMKFLPSFDWILMFIHMQMAKEKQNLLLVTFEKKWTKHVLNVTSSYCHKLRIYIYLAGCVSLFLCLYKIHRIFSRQLSVNPFRIIIIWIPTFQLRSFQEVTLGLQEVTWGLQKVTWSLQEVTWGLQEVTWGLQEVAWGLQEVTWGLQEVT